MTVNKERVELLAQALESGDHEQCTGYLRQWYFGENGETVFRSYCAEGIATKVALDNDATLREQWKELWWGEPHLNGLIMRWYGFDTTIPLIKFNGDDHVPIANVNDQGEDFWTIAQALRTTYLKDEG